MNNAKIENQLYFKAGLAFDSLVYSDVRDFT
jgi:hypothetical protein